MCQYCENNTPCGASLEIGNETPACTAQIAESLRDAIRAFASNGGLDENTGDDADRCINELVKRANKACTRRAETWRKNRQSKSKRSVKPARG